MRNLEVRMRRTPVTPEDFEVVPGAVPRLGNGGILCRARWLAVDPFACLPSGAAPHVPPAGARSDGVVPALGVCEVLESRHDVFTVGQCVVLECGMRELCVSDGRHACALHPGQAPASTALGLLGPPGMAAYFGLLDLAGLRTGESVLVSSAANVAGAMAGQVARIKGARAVGIGGSREECEWSTRHARFSACVDHRADDLSGRLRQLAPHGFDVYFDNSGGELLQAVLAGRHIATGGRIVLNSVRQDDPAELLQRSGYAAGEVAVLRASAGAYEHRRSEFLKEAIAWYGADRLVCREDVAEGIESAPAHLIRAMRGENVGRPLI
ncbi:MAG TPA: NADP-dependent oxidoreductase, partial [Acetobacteraceae bacterium]|nr:NADP-dependent oxidoreductase [Acetobacteraceae bacterium]